MCTIWQKPARRKLSQPSPAGTQERGRWALSFLVLSTALVGPVFGPAVARFAEKRCWVTARRPGKGEGQATPSCCEDGSSILRCSGAQSFFPLQSDTSAWSYRQDFVRVNRTRKAGLRLHVTTRWRWPAGHQGWQGHYNVPREVNHPSACHRLCFHAKNLPKEHTATCLVDFGSCRSKYRQEIGYLFEGCGEQLTQVSRQIHPLQTQPAPELPLSDQGFLNSIWKSKSIYEKQSQSVCRRNCVICNELNSRAQWCSQGITEGHSFGTYLVTSMWWL